MHNQSGRLVDDDEPRVFVENSQWNRLCVEQLIRRLNQPHSDPLPRKDPPGNFRGDTLHFHLPGPHDPLHPKRRVIAKMPY